MDPISIIFENTDFLIINKPSGIVVHPYDHSIEDTLLDFLREHSPECFSISNEKKLMDGRTISLGGLVHKLDRDTSGVMVIAKNQQTFDELKKQFIEHATKKTYIALVEGVIKNESFRIDAPLGRNKKEYKQSVNPTNPRPGDLREAITDVHVVAHTTNTSIVELSPLTGRTHQLRAHLAYIGHPIVGDKAYGSTVNSSRILLHAKSLSFILDGTPYSFDAPTPISFVHNIA